MTLGNSLMGITALAAVTLLLLLRLRLCDF
jgi:hypothetical protein